ncbi:phosphatases II [Sistotremastrum suecicum HHB10207 ss-3]|uniref:protein-tyrosine-phosphatase n=1 Tax=Sistotremastrum suecicum HHB10207 ss-3 TaxID=1314776 RepID=A0A166BPC7_9AGAM|nr:phosphatases II [Sistotremastrum suecicum HHB10207 ss-3]
MEMLPTPSQAKEFKLAVYPSLDDCAFAGRKIDPFIPLPNSEAFQFLRERLILRHRCTLHLSSGRVFEPQPSMILPQLYLSDQYTATSPQILDDLGITHILSLTGSDIFLNTGDRFKRLWIRLEDISTENLSIRLPETTEFIKNALAGGETCRLLVHCVWGMSRSASVIIGYLIASQYMAYDDALAFVKARRPIVRPNRGFERQLRAWEMERRREIENALEVGLRGLDLEREAYDRETASHGEVRDLVHVSDIVV